MVVQRKGGGKRRVENFEYRIILQNSFHKNINTDKKAGTFYQWFCDKQLFKSQKDVFLYLG